MYLLVIQAQVFYRKVILTIFIYILLSKPSTSFGAVIDKFRIFKGTGLLWLAGFLLLNLACQFIDNEPLVIETKVNKFNRLETSIFIALMILMAAAVFGYVNFYLAVAIVAVIVLFYRPELLRVLITIYFLPLFSSS